MKHLTCYFLVCVCVCVCVFVCVCVCKHNVIIRFMFIETMGYN